jgi:hypothetical protein
LAGSAVSLPHDRENSGVPKWSTILSAAVGKVLEAN